MKRHFTFLTVVLSFFVLFSDISCSEAASLKSSIIGKWFRVDGNEQIEFLKDGTVIVGSNAGDYKFIDDNRLRLDFKTGVIVFEVSIDKEGGLNLKEPTGRSSRYLTEKAYKVYRAQLKVEEEKKRKEEERRRKEEEEKRKAEWEKWVKERFTISDLTVLHNETKLMWTRDANIARKGMEWHDVFKFIESLNQQKYAGYNDWRLPSKEELKTLVDFAKGQGYKDFFNKIGFKNVQSHNYWSSTDAGRPLETTGLKQGWILDMRDGVMFVAYRVGYFDVWPVRAGQ